MLRRKIEQGAGMVLSTVVRKASLIVEGGPEGSERVRLAGKEHCQQEEQVQRT